MSDISILRARREEIIREIASLEQMRRGSIVEQYMECVKGKGKTKTRTGPYYLYSFKEKKKTVSRRVTNIGHVPVYRRQIESFRRFQQLAAELTAIGEKISDLALRGEAEVK